MSAALENDFAPSVVLLVPCAQELGWYDPLRKETNLNAPAIKKWLSVGAQPTETVERLLKKAMIMDP
jgi:ribosomal protein S16